MHGGTTRRQALRLESLMVWWRDGTDGALDSNTNMSGSSFGEIDKRTNDVNTDDETGG